MKKEVIKKKIIEIINCIDDIKVLTFIYTYLDKIKRKHL